MRRSILLRLAAGLAVLAFVAGCESPQRDPHAMRYYRKPPRAAPRPVTYKTRVYGSTTSVGSGSATRDAGSSPEPSLTLGRQGTNAEVSGSLPASAEARSGNWNSTETRRDSSSVSAPGVVGSSAAVGASTESSTRTGAINP